MNRKQLQTLAGDRLEDAKALLDSRRWAGAYYLAGYAVECGLKSCLLRFIEDTGAIFADEKYLNKSKVWTHNFRTLFEMADLWTAFESDLKVNVALADRWSVVVRWNEKSRYNVTDEADARALLEAVEHNPDGIFRWIQQRW